MRIHRLAFAGLGPFRTPQEIDFDRLDDVGIYLIAGRTGAGKSTVLDAISFALYGSVPRFDGTAARLRSDHSGPEDETWAELDFEAAGRVYRIRRSPEYERPRKRGGGTTTQPARVELHERIDGAWTGLSSSAKETGVEIGRIIGLTKDQFLQVILLAQNRFHEFLLAKNDDRQRLLRTLFATERYELLRRRLLAQRHESGAALEEERAAIAALADEAGRLADDSPAPRPDAVDSEWFAGLVARIRLPLETSRSAVERADDEAREALDALDAARSLRRAQERRARALRDAEELAVAESVVIEQRERLEASRRADGVAPLLRAARTADDAADAAATALERAAAAYRSLFGIDPDPAAAGAERESIDGRLGALADALAEEGRIPEATRLAEAADRDRDRAAAASRRLEEELAGHPVRIQAVEAEESELSADAATVPLRVDELAGVERRLAAAEERETAAASLSGLRAAYAEAVRAHSGSAEVHADLVARRFAGYAGELATALVPGDPCPVCGSREHPVPARDDDLAPVSNDDLEHARGAVERAAAAMDSARDRENEAALRLAALEERAGRESTEELRLRRSEVERLLRSALSAAARIEELRGERSALRARIEELAARRDVSRADHDRLAREATIASETLRHLRERVDAHRDGAASIGARVEALSLRRRVADDLVRADEVARIRGEAVAAAEDQLAGTLVEKGFPTREAAEAAALTSGERARAEAVVAEHERRRSAVEAVLAEPELHGLPTSPVDLAGAEERAGAASSRRDEARSLLSVLEHRAARLSELALLADERLLALEGRLERHLELRALAETVDGQNSRRMDLEAFALAGRLEEIVGAANLRLTAMTSGRYTLLHDDSLAYRGAASGLGIQILDAFTGARRQAASLSGGETFLASLALALGLADVVTMQSGGITLETMFIDEGFGSLDAETLETALGTLDSLRSGGRTIGLISHVDAMRERLPIGLRVVVGDRGDSTIVTD
ncbi:exonuclease SbcC [Rathayibacter oskolensis]|uniref:Nuclease SbcCD subunit C n=1 Tax=Rathayibacter oskolensis TaxID=1891671 RepID=A0A1X7ND68_9MICO|nr:AAA family ATPase [Rathayibacter oskolensis]SMH35156.1 exonuclease SbcC [Rathayibacter oskolensis]